MHDAPVSTLERVAPSLHHTADFVANRMFLKAAGHVHLRLTVQGMQRHDELGVTVHDDVRVVGHHDDLSRLLALAQLLDQQLVDERVIEVVLGLVQDDRLGPVAEDEREECSGLLAGGPLRETSPLLRRVPGIPEAHFDDVGWNVEREPIDALRGQSAESRLEPAIRRIPVPIRINGQLSHLANDRVERGIRPRRGGVRHATADDGAMIFVEATNLERRAQVALEATAVREVAYLDANHRPGRRACERDPPFRQFGAQLAATRERLYRERLSLLRIGGVWI